MHIHSYEWYGMKLKVAYCEKETGCIRTSFAKPASQMIEYLFYQFKRASFLNSPGKPCLWCAIVHLERFLETYWSAACKFALKKKNFIKNLKFLSFFGNMQINIYFNNLTITFANIILLDIVFRAKPKMQSRKHSSRTENQVKISMKLYVKLHIQ